MEWNTWCEELGVEPEVAPGRRATFEDITLLVDMNRAWKSGIGPDLYLPSLSSELAAQLEDEPDDEDDDRTTLPWAPASSVRSRT